MDEFLTTFEMAKPSKNKLVPARYFHWRLYRRGATWWADGRSNQINVGRHSLDTDDSEQAVGRVFDLDLKIAAKHGRAPQPPVAAVGVPLALDAGRRLYEEHIGQPIATGGLKPSTKKRYRTAFDKLAAFAAAQAIATWNEVTQAVVRRYATHLQNEGYAAKTLRNELTTLVQAQKWLIEEGHLVDVKPLRLKMGKVNSQKAYCYRTEEVRAMVEHCRAQSKLRWLGNVIAALACTGMRIAELASLRWTDVDLDRGCILLTDETGNPTKGAEEARGLKSGKGRMIQIHEQLRGVLATIKRHPDGFVFHGPRSGRLKPDTVRQVFVREVITPLAIRFPTPEGERGFKHGRLHSFRHYFASMCGVSAEVSELTTMEWLGHEDSQMVRHYFSLHREVARRQMAQLDPLGTAGTQLAGNEIRAATPNQEELPSQGDSASS